MLPNSMDPSLETENSKSYLRELIFQDWVPQPVAEAVSEEHHREVEEEEVSEEHHKEEVEEAVVVALEEDEEEEDVEVVHTKSTINL